MSKPFSEKNKKNSSLSSPELAHRMIKVKIGLTVVRLELFKLQNEQGEKLISPDIKGNYSIYYKPFDTYSS